ncbi:MAG: glycosyltransferase family 2 protein [Methanobacteriota archaeon]
MLPTLNEEKGVGKTIDSIQRTVFTQKGWDLEILIIDGNSKDKTREIAQQKGARVIIEKRRGYGRAYKTGMQDATGDIIVTGDADATYPFDKIHEYIQHLLDEDLDFVTTNRLSGLSHGSMTTKHRFGNLLLAWTMRILFFIPVSDSQSGMWIFKKNILSKIQDIESFNNGMPFSEEIKIEMFTKKGIRAKEIPSTLSLREGDVKLQSFSDGWKNLRFLFKKRVMK